MTTPSAKPGDVLDVSVDGTLKLIKTKLGATYQPHDASYVPCVAIHDEHLKQSHYVANVEYHGADNGGFFIPAHPQVRSASWRVLSQIKP